MDNLVLNTRNTQMDRVITATEANQRFSEVLRDVSAGESFTVTSRGKPVAEITPPKAAKRPSKEDLRALFDEMHKLPGLITGPWTRDELYER